VLIFTKNQSLINICFYAFVRCHSVA